MWGKTGFWVVGVSSLLFYVAFVVILKKKTCNAYITSEDHKDSYILETYVRIEKSEKHLADVYWMPNKDKLYDYVINDYCALGWSLYSIWHAQGRCDDFNEWLTGSFEKLKAGFCQKYISGGFPNRDACVEYMNMLSAELSSQKEKLRNLFGNS